MAPRGRPVQIDPVKFTLKLPGTMRWKLPYDGLLSSFAFNFNLHRYNVVGTWDGSATRVYVDGELKAGGILRSISRPRLHHR
jgi:hypothetical protein